MDLNIYESTICFHCKATGKNPKKRKEKCPECNGTGTIRVCIECKKSPCACNIGIMY